MSRSGPGYFGDKRQYPRYSISGTGRFSVDDEITVQGSLLDISIAGVGLMVAHDQAQRIQPGGDVGVLYLQAEDLPGPVQCYATIARQLNCLNGQVLFGLEIASIEDADLAKLRAYTVLAGVRRHKLSNP